MFKHGGRFYISVDLEGIAGVVGEYGKGLGMDTPGYAFAKKQGTREANAAVKALYDAGAGEVWVWDCHCKGYNLDYDLLDKRVKIVMGAGGRERFPLINTGFDGVLFIGYHAYDTPSAVLAHVYSSSTFQYQKINGDEAGEMQIDGAIAGNNGVPVIFVSSDDICVAQARKSFGEIPAVITKTGLAWNSCVSKHPAAVCDEIYTEVKKAAENIESFKPYVIESPFEYEIRYKRIEYAESARLNSYDNKPFERIDAYTVKGYLNKPEDIF
ncbi:MAG: M55 family metallopeptidase [Eubacteriales bacterium]|nr:M55 family metallopeptidase [Eubacteriales bacterium]